MIRAAILLFVAVSVCAGSSSLDLSASNGYAFTSDSPELDFAGSFTIEMRFRTNTAHDGCLIAKFHQSSGSPLDDSYYILVQSDGSMEARIQTELLLVTLTAPGAVHDSQWHHVALVYDIDLQVAELYVDGALGDSAFLTGALRDTGESVRLGALLTTTSLADFYDGQLDEMRFWEIARRGEQAGCLADVTLLTDTPGLISYYPFDEEVGTTAGDLVAPFENFTLISGATFSFDEPVYLSRLSGPGACLCGNVSGSFADMNPIVTLVGDTVTIAAGDTLSILSNSMIVDSSVSIVHVLGSLQIVGTISDSSHLFGQSSASSAAEIHFQNPDTVTSRVAFTRISGFASRPMKVLSAVLFQRSLFSECAGGAMRIGANAALDTVTLSGCDSVAVVIDSAVTNITGCLFDGNGGALTASAATGTSCTVVIDSTTFTGNSGEQGSAILLNGLPGDAPVKFSMSNCTFAENASQSGAASTLRGSGVTLADARETLIDHSVFYDNTDDFTIHFDQPYDATPLELRNLTVVANSCSTAAVSLEVPSILRNSIVTANNSPSQIIGSAPGVAYCITSDTEYHGPGGSFDADPLFEDYLLRDLRLTAGSPAINSGDPSLLDADSTRSDIGAIPADDFSPALESILDVGADNGRHVMVQWLPSSGDDSRAGIESYQIYREVTLPILENFELLAVVPAAQLPGYGQIVTTLSDSNDTGLPYYRYFVRAQSSNPLAFWDTPIDSGYSVDDLAPGIPLLFAEENSGDVDLNWTAAPDSDLAYYAVYRDSVLFDPDTVTQIYSTTTDTTFLDSGLSGDGYAYAVRSVDRNGNFSEASNVAWVDIIILDPPVVTLTSQSGFLVLRWTPVPYATDYLIYRADSPDDPGEQFASTTGFSFLMTADDPIKFYRVVAVR